MDAKRINNDHTAAQFVPGQSSKTKLSNKELQQIQAMKKTNSLTNCIPTAFPPSNEKIKVTDGPPGDRTSSVVFHTE